MNDETKIIIENKHNETATEEFKELLFWLWMEQTEQM